ncbi:class I SAM-dependent methyltransferase [Streptomyces sp. NPDC059740]|uniref:class I SAM-dependent methyltransferase n=1 Tax=Streptomyces sp. NPDC059740 TaxID=3346926 RepID=UPI0036575F56
MTTAPLPAQRPRELNDVRGWFPPLDQVLFEWTLDRQEARGLRGDLLEIGVFLGKSAIFAGRHLQDGESFTVCDLFEGKAPDEANRAESTKSYSALTRAAFEANYLAFHQELPRVLQGPSSLVPGAVAAGSCRFVHVDGSHLYEHVHQDITAAREVLRPGGVVVLDDFRSEHTPGVAVAAWEAVLVRGLRPVCLSTQKLYATWDDPTAMQDELIERFRGRADCHLSVQQAAGHRLVRLKSKGLAAPAFPQSRHATGEPAPVPALRPAAPGGPARGRGAARRVAADLLPPVVTRAVRRSRAARRAANGRG